MAAATEQGLKSCKVADIVKTQKEDPFLLYRRSSGGAGWKRVYEFSASNSRRDQNPTTSYRISDKPNPESSNGPPSSRVSILYHESILPHFGRVLQSPARGMMPMSNPLALTQQCLGIVSTFHPHKSILSLVPPVRPTQTPFASTLSRAALRLSTNNQEPPRNA